MLIPCSFATANFEELSFMTLAIFFFRGLCTVLLRETTLGPDDGLLLRVVVFAAKLWSLSVGLVDRVLQVLEDNTCDFCLRCLAINGRSGLFLETFLLLSCSVTGISGMLLCFSSRTLA